MRKVERLFELSILEGKEVLPFGRIKQIPQSILSRLVFFDLLGTDDGGFTMTKSEISNMFDKRHLQN